MKNIHKHFQRLCAGSLLLACLAVSDTAFATTAAPAPSAPDLVDNSDTGSSQYDNITKNPRPLFSGTGKPNCQIRLFRGATLIGSSYVLPSGFWFVMPTVAFKDGSRTVQAQQIVNGLPSDLSAGLTIQVDTIAPGAPARPNLAESSDSGACDDDNVTNNLKPLFRGEYAPGSGSSMRLYNRSLSSTVPIGSAPIDVNSSWICATSTLFPWGTHTYAIAAQSYDVAGNTSPFSSATMVYFDTDRPKAPTKFEMLAKDDSGVSNSDRITNNNSPTFRIEATPSDMVVMYSDEGTGRTLSAQNVTAVGWVLLKPFKPLNDGNYRVLVTSYDRAGNRSIDVLPALPVVIDTFAPAVAISSPLQNATLTQLSQVSGSASDMVGVSEIRVSLQRTVNNVVQFWNGNAFTTTFASHKAQTNSVGYQNVTWQIGASQLPPKSVLTPGKYVLFAASYDAAGNTGLSTARPFTVAKTAAAFQSPSAGSS